VAILVAISIMFSTVFPLPILVVGSLMALRLLSKLKISPNVNADKKQKMKRASNVSLVLIPFVFVLLKLPLCLFLVQGFLPDFMDSEIGYFLALDLPDLCLGLNAAINLPLYVIPGTHFRAVNVDGAVLAFQSVGADIS